MSDISAGGNAHDASVAAAPSRDADRALAKARGAVGYHQQALAAAETGVANLEAKIDRLRDQVEAAQAGMVDLVAQRDQALADLDAAQAHLAQLEA